MDEPSSGMDPGSRNMVRDIIKEAVRNGQSVLMTSHSMSECDALCDRSFVIVLIDEKNTIYFRLAIMKAGSILCEGNPTELKAKEGDGYKVNVKLKNIEQKEELDKFLTTNFIHIKKGAEKEKWITYNLVGNISEMLGVLATAKNQFELEGFTINMISLEDVFLQVTKGKHHFIYNPYQYFQKFRH